GWVVFDGGRAVVDRPLAEIDAVRAPFEHAAANLDPLLVLLKTADHAATLLEIEAVEELRVVGSPRGGAEVNVPVHDILVGLRLSGEPAAGDGEHSAGVSVNRFELAELAGASEL